MRLILQSLTALEGVSLQPPSSEKSLARRLCVLVPRTTLSGGTVPSAILNTGRFMVLMLVVAWSFCCGGTNYLRMVIWSANETRSKSTESMVECHCVGCYSSRNMSSNVDGR